VDEPESSQSRAADSTISREEIVARLQDRTLAIVNVMPKATYDDGHIPGSINLPVAEIAAQARRVIPDLAQEIAIYCMGPT
jgi:rhodanese-related sulfurtransferase